jgi:hypothetical protein
MDEHLAASKGRRRRGDGVQQLAARGAIGGSLWFFAGRGSRGPLQRHAELLGALVLYLRLSLQRLDFLDYSVHLAAQTLASPAFHPTSQNKWNSTLFQSTNNPQFSNLHANRDGSLKKRNKPINPIDVVNPLQYCTPRNEDHIATPKCTRNSTAPQKSHQNFHDPKPKTHKTAMEQCRIAEPRGGIPE